MMLQDASPCPVPRPRDMGPVNWLGLWTLYIREVRRFTKVWLQTIAAPVMTSLLFLAIFALAFGPQRSISVELVSFMEFLAPGLIMMTIVQNAFANTSSSVTISKIQGNIVDTLMSPLSPWELVVGFTLGGVTRGLVVGVCVSVAMLPFVTLHIHSIPYIIFHTLGASVMLSVLGIMAGLWSEKFDHIASITNFVITPLSFLSGTFYSVDRLPEAFFFIAHANPFFYMIDGFRYGFIGHPSSLPLTGVAVILVFNIGLLLLCHRLIRSGYRLKN